MSATRDYSNRTAVRRHCANFIKVTQRVQPVWRYTSSEAVEAPYWRIYLLSAFITPIFASTDQNVVHGLIDYIVERCRMNPTVLQLHNRAGQFLKYLFWQDIGTYRLMPQADPLQSHLPLPAWRWYAQWSSFTSLPGKFCRLSSTRQSLRWTNQYNIRLAAHSILSSRYYTSFAQSVHTREDLMLQLCTHGPNQQYVHRVMNTDRIAQCFYRGLIACAESLNGNTIYRPPWAWALLTSSPLWLIICTDHHWLLQCIHDYPLTFLLHSFCTFVSKTRCNCSMRGVLGNVALAYGPDAHCHLRRHKT